MRTRTIEGKPERNEKGKKGLFAACLCQGRDSWTGSSAKHSCLLSCAQPRSCKNNNNCSGKIFCDSWPLIKLAYTTSDEIIAVCVESHFHAILMSLSSKSFDYILPIRKLLSFFCRSAVHLFAASELIPPSGWKWEIRNFAIDCRQKFYPIQIPGERSPQEWVEMRIII